MASSIAASSPSIELFVLSFCLQDVVLKGIEYNSSTKGECENTNEIVTTGSTENCESENDKKVSFHNVTNVG